jgi:hypothetical protein
VRGSFASQVVICFHEQWLSQLVPGAGEAVKEKQGKAKTSSPEVFV